MSAVLRAARGPGGGGGPDAPASLARRWARRPRACSVGLWVFMGVASTLFSLFGVAYVMRLANADAVAIAMPPQLLLSTAWLVLASVLLQGAAATSDWPERSRAWLLAGGLCSLGFLATQGWAWQALMARAVGPAGNPAASFFYLLSALHALHLAGGLAGWALAARAAWDTGAAPVAAWRITLCARYWHFLLLLWGVLFLVMAGLTPEIVRWICG
jgi:cytochrome c oxidase subunit 3